ncbi:MAG: hypothetical protein QM811_15525 [Pirellulales bacterium]
MSVPGIDLGPDTAILATTWLLAAGVTLSTCEWLALRREFRSGGMYDWNIISVVHERNRKSALAMRLIGNYPVFLAVLILRLAAAVGLFLLPTYTTSLLLGVLLVSHALLHFRCVYGLEGADQMHFLVTAALWVDSLFQDPSVRDYSLGFIALQGCLSYFVAGVAKLFGPLWRDGTAIGHILNTRSFGARWVASFFSRRPNFGCAATYGVLAFELLFPLTLVLPTSAALGILALGVLFHVVNAFVMGLNLFVWSFVATYPAVLYLGCRINAAVFQQDA